MGPRARTGRISSECAATTAVDDASFRPEGAVSGRWAGADALPGVASTRLAGVRVVALDELENYIAPSADFSSARLQKSRPTTPASVSITVPMCAIHPPDGARNERRISSPRTSCTTPGRGASRPCCSAANATASSPSHLPAHGRPANACRGRSGRAPCLLIASMLASCKRSARLALCSISRRAPAASPAWISTVEDEIQNSQQ